jgi:hypothetical protein
MFRLLSTVLMAMALLAYSGCITDVTNDPKYKPRGYDVGNVYVLKQPAVIAKESGDLSAAKGGPTHLLSEPKKEDPNGDLVQPGTRLEYKKTFLYRDVESGTVPVAYIRDGPHAGKRVDLSSISTGSWQKTHYSRSRDDQWLREPAK